MAFDVDTSGLEELLSAADGLGLLDLAAGLADDGEADAKARLETVLYSTPDRPPYERTRLLQDSVRGSAALTAEGFEVTLSAVGGSGGKAYAAANETGTLQSHRSLEALLREARSSPDPLSLPPDTPGRGGLEARPYISPALAEMERKLEGKLFGAIAKAVG